MGNPIPIYPIYQGETLFPLADRRSPRLEAALAALPHLWIGIAAAAIRFASVNDAGWLSRLGIYSLYAFAAVSLALLAYAWLHRWPLWSASWYFYILWIGILLLGYLDNKIGENLSVLYAILILGSLGAMAVGYLFLFRVSRLHALLAGLFLMPIATQFELEAIPDNLEAAIAILFAVLASCAALGVLRVLIWSSGVVFALLANLASGLVLTYVCFYRAEIPGFYGDSFYEATLAFAFYIALAIALFIGPAVFWKAVDRIRQNSRRTQGGLV